MNSYEKLIYELSPIGIYNLSSSGTLISKELDTYAAALEKIDEKIDLLLNEMFFKSCSGEGVKKFSRLYALEDYSSAELKTLICTLLGEQFGIWNKAAWDFESAKIEGAVFGADGEGKSFSVTDFNLLSKEQKAAAVGLIRKYIACHLRLKVNMGFRTWNETEQAEYSFNDFGLLGLTFDEIEIFD